MTKPAVDPVTVAERRCASGAISRQRLHQIRKANDAPPARMGSPPLPVAMLARNARGNVELRVLLPDDIMAAVDVLVEGPPPLRGRKAVVTHALPLGFAAMLKRAPRVHEAPAGERKARGAQGPVLEVPPAELARIDAYAAEHGTARSVVVAMAVVRGVAAMKRGER